MSYRTSPTSSLRHGRFAVWHKGGRAVIAMTAAFVFSGALLMGSGCGGSPKGTPETVAANTAVPATAPALASAGLTAVVGPKPSVGPSTAPAAAEPAPVQYASAANAGDALVSGTSTVHAWTVTSKKLDGHAEFSGPIGPAPAGIIALQSADLSIPVDSLKSTEGSGMDNTMYDALKLKKFPAITYKLTTASLKSPPSKDDPAYHFNTAGQLTVSGSAHPVGLDLAVIPHDGGKLTIATDTKLKMSDFGVTAPTAMLGMIKSGDAITVKVTWELARQP